MIILFQIKMTVQSVFFSNPTCPYMSDLSSSRYKMQKISYISGLIHADLLHAVSDYKKQWSEVSARVS